MDFQKIYGNAIVPPTTESKEQQQKEQYDKEQLLAQEREQHFNWLQHPVTAKLLGHLKERLGFNNSQINLILNTDFTLEGQLQLRSLNVKNQTIAEIISYVTTNHNSSTSGK